MVGVMFLVIHLRIKFSWVFLELWSNFSEGSLKKKTHSSSKKTYLQLESQLTKFWTVLQISVNKI